MAGACASRPARSAMPQARRPRRHRWCVAHVEHDAERRAVRRRRGLAGRVQRRRDARGRGGRPPGVLYALNLADGSVIPGLGQRAGPDHRLGPGVQRREPGRRPSGPRHQRPRGPREPAHRLDRVGRQRQRRRPLLRRRQRRLARRRWLLRVLARRQPGVEPGRHQPAHRHDARRRRAGIALARRRRVARGGGLARTDDLRPVERERRPRHRLAPVLRRQRVLHRRRGRPLRHRVRQLRRPGAPRRAGSPTASSYSDGGHVRI